MALEDEPEHERGHDRHERLADQNGGHNVCNVGLGCGAGDDGSLRRDGRHTSGHQALLTDQDEHQRVEADLHGDDRRECGDDGKCGHSAGADTGNDEAGNVDHDGQDPHLVSGQRDDLSGQQIQRAGLRDGREQQRDADERGKHGGAEAADQIFIGQAEDAHHDNAECDCHNTDVDLAEESQQDHDDEQHQRDNVKCSFHK